MNVSRDGRLVDGQMSTSFNEKIISYYAGSNSNLFQIPVQEEVTEILLPFSIVFYEFITWIYTKLAKEDSFCFWLDIYWQTERGRL